MALRRAKFLGNTALAFMCFLMLAAKARGSDFEDEESSHLGATELEDVSAPDVIDIDDLPRNGFSASSLEGEYEHDQHIADADLPQQKPIESTHEFLERQAREQIVARMQLQAGLRWQRFGQVTAGILEENPENPDDPNGLLIDGFEEMLVDSDSAIGFEAEIRAQLPFLQPGRTPYTVLWDDPDEVKAALEYAFRNVLANHTKNSTASGGLPVTELPAVMVSFLDPLSQGMHSDELRLAQKLLLHFAHDNGLANELGIIRLQHFSSPQFLDFFSGIIHRMWSMREFRNSITKKVEDTGTQQLSEAEMHYLHLRDDLIVSLVNSGAVSESDAEWLRHEERKERRDRRLAPHPTVSFEEMQDETFSRILQGDHEEPKNPQAGVPPDYQDYANLGQYLQASQAFFSSSGDTT